MHKFHNYSLPPYQIKQAKRKRRKAKLWTFLCLFFALIILLFIYFQRNVTRVLVEISEATMRASTTIAVNDAVYYTLGDEMRYDDLVTIIRGENGDILSFTAN